MPAGCALMMLVVQQILRVLNMRRFPSTACRIAGVGMCLLPNVVISAARRTLWPHDFQIIQARQCQRPWPASDEC